MKFTFQSGDRPLPDYTIRRALGHGGFGEVYYAVSDAGKEVALKYILQYHDVELRGVRHCMNLKCPNLVTIFDVRENDAGQVFVLMEYVAGPSLSQLITDRGGTLPREEALSILRQIATALDYLHSRGIVHRDLKPSNVFVEDGVAKIGDYGLSKFVSISEHNDHTINVGSVHYMAPEVGSGKYGTGVDIYAMGAVLYQMTTGRPPFEGDTAAEILMKHLTAEPDLSPVPSGFRSVVGRALAKNPDERFQSASEMVAALTGDLKAAPQDDRGARTDPTPEERRRREEPTLITPPTHRRGPSWWHRSWRRAQVPPQPEVVAQQGLSFLNRLFLAAASAVAFALCMNAICPQWSRIHLHRVTGFILAGALGVTLANRSLRAIGVAEPLAHRIYSLVIGLLFVYGYQRVWQGIGPMPIHQNQWLVFFVIVLLFGDWYSRSAQGRSKAVSSRLCVRAGIIGGIAGLFAGVDFWPGFCVAATMAFFVQLLTYGPVLGRRDLATEAYPWLRRLFWCLGAGGAGAAAVASLCWARGHVQPLSEVSAPMSFCACVWAFWFCVCKVASRPSSDVWTGAARPTLLAAALTAGGFALAAGLGGARGFRVLAFTSVAFCACIALSMKALPPMACRPARGLPGRYVLLWLSSLLLFAFFCVLPSVGLTAWMWVETPLWHVLSFWCGAALLSAVVLFAHWGRLRLAAVLSALTFACLLVLAFAFSHYAAHYQFGHMFGLWMPNLRGTVLVEPSPWQALRAVPFATRQVALIGGPLLLAALVVLWPAARDPEIEPSDAAGDRQ